MSKVFCDHCRAPVAKGDDSNAPSVCSSCGRPLGSGTDADDGSLTQSFAAKSRATATDPASSPVMELLSERSRSDGRFVLQDEIARGSMGVVRRAVDSDMDREVAIKYLLDGDDVAYQLRFVEEARITGRLEHPNIVPIHELGVDENRRLFFAMKMVKGRSLAAVLRELRDNPATAEQEWSLGRLLNVLNNVCYAVAYAHSRGVIHRDLKPANIMLGDFGETYVMDWGLAKPVGSGDEAQSVERSATVDKNSHCGSDSGGGSSKAATARAVEGEWTEDGAVLGTPSYMSPEQARGEVQRLDVRGDVYSLGAVLYELLALQSPVKKEGGAQAILDRVVRGEIEPPEVRSPERARAGKIPKELSAVALKALALRPADRYASVEELRRDLERFQEGRSVSAKEDTAWEAITKLVKRNKAVSLTTAAALLILATVSIVAYQFNYAARVRAEQANASFLEEQRAKNETIVRSIPAMVRAARQMANDGAVSAALDQIALVQSYDPENLGARFLSGAIRLAQKDWPAAGRELAEYVRRNPSDAAAVKMREIAASGKTTDVATLFDAAGLLHDQHLDGLTPFLLDEVERKTEAKKALMTLYRKQIAAIWPNGNGYFRVADGELEFDFAGQAQLLSDLAPVRRFQIDRLRLSDCVKVSDLEPLRGMPLTALNLHGCKLVKHLEPLRGMPLRDLNIGKCAQFENKDLDVLRGMRLERLYLDSTLISDLSPLTGMPLTDLTIRFSPVADLGPLHGMPLEALFFSGAYAVEDLEPLRGLPCRTLVLSICPKVKNLEPLQGMPCVALTMIGLHRVTSLEPLRGMPCEELRISSCDGIKSLDPLKGMPCRSLVLSACEKVTDLEPLRGMPLEHLEFNDTAVTDLTPLEGLDSLVQIRFSAAAIRKGIGVLGRLKNLQRIYPHRLDTGSYYSPQDFLKRYEAGEFAQDVNSSLLAPKAKLLPRAPLDRLDR